MDRIAGDYRLWPERLIDNAEYDAEHPFTRLTEDEKHLLAVPSQRTAAQLLAA